MKKLKVICKDLGISICCSFTVIVIANVFLAGEEYAMSIGTHELKETFWICVITCCVVRAIGALNFQREWMSHLVGFLGMSCSVFVLGTFVFQLIPLEFSVYVSVSIMLIIIYSFVIFLIYVVDKNEADAINEKLVHRTKAYKENDYE